jgi:hypothetical protein
MRPITKPSDAASRSTEFRVPLIFFVDVDGKEGLFGFMPIAVCSSKYLVSSSFYPNTFICGEAVSVRQGS